MKHELKILPAYYEAVLRGDKKFEVRNNSDRGFQKGDVVVLREYNPELNPYYKRYTGNEIIAEITYVTDFNQPTNQVVFGFKVLEE